MKVQPRRLVLHLARVRLRQCAHVYVCITDGFC